MFELHRRRNDRKGDGEVDRSHLASEEIPDVDILKAAHHGARDGVTPAWLDRTKPEVVVISVAFMTRYRHPHEAALRYYRAGKRRFLRTDEHGEVVVRVHADGSYVVRTASESETEKQPAVR